MTDCVLWERGRMSKGYGIVRVDDRPQLAHRVAWINERGPIPAGMQIHHECGVRLCLNTAHMRLVSAAEHPAADATRRTCCKHGHEYTPENTRSRRGWRECLICVRATKKRARDRARAAR